MRKMLLLLVLCMPTFFYGQVQSTETVVQNVTVAPFSKICHLRVFRDRMLPMRNQWKNSTGFFIGRNYILTAAHNLAPHTVTKATQIEIIIGQHKNKALYDTIRIEGLNRCQMLTRTPAEYGLGKSYKKRIKYDFGLIYVPDSLLPSDFSWNNELKLDANVGIKENQLVTLAGYPADTRHGYDGSLLISQKGKINQRDNNVYEHQFQTYGGNSGSPVWIEEIPNSFTVIGIHTFSTSGTLINTEVINQIKQWIAEFINI